MSNERQSQGSTPDAEAERVLQRLFAHAEPRPLPPEADAEEIRRAVYAEWDDATGRRVFRRRAGFAAAASVALAFALWVGFAPSPSNAPTLARVERVDGLESGGSLRIGAQSRVVLTGADAAELLAGVLYFDSEDARDDGAAFNVATSLGNVRDVGTQFLARLDNVAGRFDVGVRSGRIELTSVGETGAAGVGERLVVMQDGASIRRDTVATFGGDWDWVERVAPPFETDGRTIGDFLAWFEEQTGRTVVFGSTAAERAALEKIAGSIDLPLLQELAAVLAIADLTYAFDGERVVIDSR